MKNLIKLLLVTIFASQFVWAGLPPTSVKGVSDATPQTKFQFQVPFSHKTDLGGIKALFEDGYYNVLVNSSFDNVTYNAGWTTVIGGSTASQDLTTFTDGTAAYKIVSPGGPIAGFTLTQDVTPPQDFGNKTMEASCWVKNTISALTPQICGRVNGANVTSSCTTLPTDGVWHKVSAGNFTAVTAQAVGLQFTVGTSPSAGTLDIDECYLGEARNIGTVQQAVYYGGVVTPATTGCFWNDFNSTSFAQPSANASCPVATVTGAASAPATKIPAITFTSMPAGDYYFIANGIFQTNTQTAYFRFTDGTNSTPGVGVFATSGGAGESTITGHITYSSNQSNVTIKVQGATSNVADPGQITVNTTTPGVGFEILVYYFPSSAQQVLTSNTSPANWSGSSSLSGTTTSGTIADLGGISGSIATLYSQNISCVAATSQVGVTCTLPTTGMYQVCYTGDAFNGTATASSFFQLTDGSNNIISPSQNMYTAAAGITAPLSSCSNYNATSTTATFKVRASCNAGSLNFNSTGFSILSLNTPVAAPIVTNSITTNANAPWRVETAIWGGGSTSGIPTSTCTSSPCNIASQSGTWLSSVTRTGTGTYVMNFAAGIFTAPPNCTFSTGYPSVTPGGYAGPAGTPAITTSTYTLAAILSGAAADSVVSAICMGPR